MHGWIRFLPFLLLASLFLTLAACEGYPEDPNDTLMKVFERDTLRVGVISSSPWVVGSAPDQPTGYEVELIEGFAEELEVVPHFVWASEETLMDALSFYELDVVIGGLTKKNPWKKHVALTVPYHTSRTVFGFPPGATPRGTFNGGKVAIERFSGLDNVVNDYDAQPVEVDRIEDSDIPVLTEDWKVDGMGFGMMEKTIRKHRHVMAVPPGENAFLMRLGKYLLNRTEDQNVSERLWEILSEN